MTESWHTVSLHVRVTDPDKVIAYARESAQIDAEDPLDIDDALRIILDPGLLPCEGAEIDDSASECISWNQGEA